jgi:hypothetical protein
MGRNLKKTRIFGVAGYFLRAGGGGDGGAHAHGPLYGTSVAIIEIHQK